MGEGESGNNKDNAIPEARDEGSPNVPVESRGSRKGEYSAPEPPPNWKPEDSAPRTQPPLPSEHDPSQDEAVVGKIVLKLERDEVPRFESARKFIMASQITALVSLFFGGMLLSCVAIVLAVLGFRILSEIAANRVDQPYVQKALKRSGLIAIGMSVLALVVNAVTLFVMYPILMQTLQEEGISGLIPGLQAGSSTSQPSSGSSLFG